MYQQLVLGSRRALVAVLTLMSMILAGCAAEVTVKDGQAYYGAAKVHYHGDLEAIRLYDKTHQTRLLVKDEDGRLLLGSEKASDIGEVADDNMPFHSFGYSIVTDVLALVVMGLADDESDRRAPSYSDLLIRTSDGKLRTLPIMNDMLKRHIRFGCIEVGEPVMIIDGPRNVLVPVHGDARLQRRSDLLPSCASLRAKFDYPQAQTIWE